MEALGPVASIVAVTTIALQSAKAFYKTVNGVKNGPKEFNDLASAVNHLSYILEKVNETCNMLGDPDGTDLSGLLRVMDECGQTLVDFRKQLEKLDVSSDKRRLGKTWKRMKLVIQKGDFRGMRESVQHYIAVIGTHLSIIGRRMDQNHNNEFSRHMLQTGTDSKVLKQNNDMLKQVEHHIGALGSGFARQETQRKLVIRDIKDGHQAANRLGERLNDLAGMSSGQHETMMDKLARIQNQVEELKCSIVDSHEMSTPKVTFAEDSRQEEAENHADDNRAGNELSESIDRLCGLANKPRSTVFSEEAQQVIADLEKILSLISTEGKSPETYGTGTRKQDQLVYSELAEGSRDLQQKLDLKRLQGLLTTSPSISINERASFDTKITAEIRRHRKATFQNYVTNTGAVSVQVKRRRLINNADQGEDDILTRNVDEAVQEVFEGTVSFIPSRTTCRTKISTSFFQRSTNNGYFSLKPRLSFCAIIPDNSEIFALISNGDLEGIINHLQQGKGSLSDCDSEGRTLLNHALHCFQIEISKFLIDKGADVDAIEPRLHYLEGDEDEDEVTAGYAMSPLDRLSQFRMDVDRNEEGLEVISSHRRLLLEAGADPMPFDSIGDLFSGVSSKSESLKMVLNLGGEFINCENRDEAGHTLLLLCAEGYGCGIDSQCIKALLDRGASIKARDNRGWTCLHCAMSAINCPGRRDSEKVSVLLMVKAGANVYATDDNGISVSHMAYTPNDWDRFCNLGSYRGELWDEVLTECGYDAAWFREDYRNALSQVKSLRAECGAKQRME